MTWTSKPGREVQQGDKSESDLVVNLNWVVQNTLAKKGYIYAKIWKKNLPRIGTTCAKVLR